MTETIVELKDGCTLRSDCADPDYMAGEYVRLCDPDGNEIDYWHWDEWQEDPILVMGAIMRSAAGVRLNQKELAKAKGFV